MDEMSDWGTYSIGKGVSGLQLCDSSSGYSSAYCDTTSRCSGAYGSNCRPDDVWSGNVNGSSTAYYYDLYGGSWGQSNRYRSRANSVRCVSEMPQSCAQKISEGCLTCDGYTCLSCDSGYILKDGVCKIDCATKFGSSCSECNLAQCTKCAEGYHMGSRKNMGDSVNLPIASGVNIKQINQSCSPSASNYCCWQGNTSASDCDNSNGGGYSGCNRTVCDWWAADYICKNFHAGNYTWRLATTSEMSGWGSNSKGKGTSGLQLCDSSSGNSSAYCDKASRCSGTRNSRCYPADVWSGNVNGSSRAYYYYLGGGSWSQYYIYRTDAHSVRCVTEL